MVSSFTNYSQLLWEERYIYIVCTSTSHIPKYMELKRFEILLRTIHFSNNELCLRGDRLFNVQGLIDLIILK